MESILFSLVIMICASSFIGIGIFAWQKKTPMHFWSGTEVKAEEITNIGAYNKANGVMWISYGCAYIITSLLAFVLRNAVAVVLLILLCTAGIAALVIVYRRIYEKYKV